MFGISTVYTLSKNVIFLVVVVNTGLLSPGVAVALVVTNYLL